MKVLVTGAAGFIGEKVANELLKNHSVSVIDFPNKFSKKQKEKYDTYEFDISKKDWIECLIK